MDNAYYWAICGRIHSDVEDTPFCTDLPATQSEAVRQYLDLLRDQAPERYCENGVILFAAFRSTEPIECMS